MSSLNVDDADMDDIQRCQQVCIVAPDGTIESWLHGLMPARATAFDPKLLAELKALVTSANGQPELSNLAHDPAGRPVFYLVKALPNHRLGVGILSTDYLVSLQQAIAFGDHGHAVITDAK